MRRLIACLVLLAGLTGLCRAAEDPALQRVVEATVSAYVLPAYDTLHRQTTALVETVDKFCRSPSSNNADAATAAFAEVLSAWAAVDFLRIGPMAQGGRYERFAFWPDVHGTGARQLRQFLARRDESLLDPRALAEQSAAVQGLPALESLLFGGSKALLKSAPPDPYRCALALAISRNADLIAAETAAAWRAEWASILTTPGPGNPVYRSPDEAMTEVLRAVLTGLEQLRDHRLVPVLGDASKPALASRAAYNPSGQALPYLQASAVALERFVRDSQMLSLLPEPNRWIGESILFEFANLRGALDAAGDDLDAALQSPEAREKLSYSTIVLASLRDLIQNQFSPAAGLTPGFNSLDGD